MFRCKIFLGLVAQRSTDGLCGHLVSQTLQTIKVSPKYANGYFTIINGVLVEHVLLIKSLQCLVFNLVISFPLAAAPSAGISCGPAWSSPGLAAMQFGGLTDLANRGMRLYQYIWARSLYL